MCGRYRLSRRKQIIEEYFETAPWDDDWNPRFNIAPTQPVPVIRQHPKEPVRQISLMKWGLIPHWAKDPSVAMGTINAKSETAAETPAFRDPFRLRRCLIPADGFYEWTRKGTSKQPYCFEVKDGDLFAFAGLWDGVERRERKLDEDLLDPDYNSQRRDLSGPRPEPCDSRSEQLRSVAGPRNAERSRHLRNAETLRLPV
jgi:putative SOS response-associated peptidase YedK